MHRDGYLILRVNATLDEGQTSLDSSTHRRSHFVYLSNAKN
jgi:hypothetical protein